MGLLLAHKSTVSIYPDMVSVSINHSTNSQGGGKRNEITGFSKGSRYRLFRLLHSIRFERVTFVTLTYGSRYPETGKDAKKNLKAFRRAIERRYGKVAAVWRLEFQQRGSPHFHIMYFDAPFLPVREICEIWDNACHTPKSERFGNSLDLKFNSEPKGSDVVGKYIGKYIGKLDDRETEENYADCGRIWGKWNIEEPKPEKIELWDYEAKMLSKMILPDPNAPGWHPMFDDCYTVFGPQMGLPLFENHVKTCIQAIFGRTRAGNHKRVEEEHLNYYTNSSTLGLFNQTKLQGT